MTGSKLSTYARVHDNILKALVDAQELAIIDAVEELRKADEAVLKDREKYLQELEEEIERR